MTKLNSNSPEYMLVAEKFTSTFGGRAGAYGLGLYAPAPLAAPINPLGNPFGAGAGFGGGLYGNPVNPV
jgi:hypothetical protein